ncbi:unnamed protein product [Malassezia sympodialis ATCC 42132]|uniref:Ubiquinone biosynthesis O-methyltransferase, mitochondrial n=1 Tax=Malassezia sympodialis (strain ATCC 42132) TaxID=1230383 RepID=M5ELZ7_MALS4|nr:uncharacterized protein MSY001_1363 [Malassezia sympodialis ATCC 42132]CCU98657.1 unnamed protein product [Malassezia sympodialis ATCC 42132]SHO79491.1 Similar to S.cerevisiae protein COQ3 (O-methyltransferase) [Malassezia sympodialis ATCC 42132]|eukprot:XP_018739950.1 uncharacterized protein MSY001_1363 [Malassezia sympodialis ATCC 42132]
MAVALGRSSAFLRRAPRYAAAAVRYQHTAASVDPADIAHFSRLANEWWNENGEFAPLHRMNRVRIEFMRQKLEEVRGWDAALADVQGAGSVPPPPASPAFLAGQHMLDVGCGGGILAESAARLGARVTGVDASAENIRVASMHAAQDPAIHLRAEGDGPGAADGSIQYVHSSAEALRDAGHQFDIVTAMEVVEHVNRPDEFLRCLAALIKPGGHLFLSTMSRTALSYLLTIFLAENVLRVVTPGTHRHSQYINPAEMVAFFRELGWIPTESDVLTHRATLPDGSLAAPCPPRLQYETRGTMYVPVLGRWVLAPQSTADEAATGPSASTWLPTLLGGGMRPTELCNYFFWIRRPA